MSPAQLRVDNIEEEDAGNFSCRVDFRNSPTVATTVNLQVVVSVDLVFLIGGNLQVVERATKPTVLSDDGTEVMGSIGPYRLGEALVLVCLAEGKPPPAIKWLIQGELFDNEMDPMESGDKAQRSAGGQRRNTLVIESLTREHSGVTLRCVAENTELQQPPYTDIVIELSLPVVSVTMASLPSPITAGERLTPLCQAWGGHPPPSLQWSLTSESGISKPLQAAGQTIVSMGGNLSTSSLEIVFNRSDHGSLVTCKASSSLFPSVSTEIKLQVICSLTLPSHQVHHPPGAPSTDCEVDRWRDRPLQGS